MRSPLVPGAESIETRLDLRPWPTSQSGAVSRTSNVYGAGRVRLDRSASVSSVPQSRDGGSMVTDSNKQLSRHDLVPGCGCERGPSEEGNQAILRTLAPRIFFCFKATRARLASSRAYSWTSGFRGIAAARSRNSRTSARVTLATLRTCFSSQRWARANARFPQVLAG